MGTRRSLGRESRRVDRSLDAGHAETFDGYAHGVGEFYCFGCLGLSVHDKRVSWLLITPWADGGLSFGVTRTAANLAHADSLSMGVWTATEICTSSAALAATQGYRVAGQHLRM